jgi:DNA polymerase III gamma/tau subunit
MTQHLSKIAELEGIQASEDTLNRAARRVNGHVRDGIQQLEMIKLIGEQGYKDTFKIIDEQFTVLLDLFIKGDLEKAKQVVLDITSNPVIYIDQDFSVYIRRILDDVYLNKNKDNRLKDIVNHWLRMHRYLKSTNDWYLFLMSLGGILGKGGGDDRPTRPVNRFSR